MQFVRLRSGTKYLLLTGKHTTCYQEYKKLDVVAVASILK